MTLRIIPHPWRRSVHQTSENEQLTSYLLAVEGAVIADLMDSYDSRLLESNVRTYLKETKTNKGILKTIKTSPIYFLHTTTGSLPRGRQNSTRRAEP